MNTVLITGASSGYGLETARHFHAKGWKVIATMRNPRQGLLPDDVRVLSLYVTDPAIIAAAVEAAGQIYVLVNNAGIGLVGAFEAAPMDYVRKMFETNTFGTMAMVQAVIPQMRVRRSGVIVNVTSSVTLVPMPLAAAYTASKQAIEGFTGSLAHELAAFGISARLVEPGYAPTTRFSQNIDFAIEDSRPRLRGPDEQPRISQVVPPPRRESPSCPTLARTPTGILQSRGYRSVWCALDRAHHREQRCASGRRDGISCHQ